MASTVLSLRLPDDLAEAIDAAAADAGATSTSEWARNALRDAVGQPLGIDAGYREGFAAGWSDANDRIRLALGEAAKQLRTTKQA